MTYFLAEGFTWSPVSGVEEATGFWHMSETAASHSDWLSYRPLAVPYVDFPQLHVVGVTYIATHPNLVD